MMNENGNDPIAWENVDEEEQHGIVLYTEDGDELALQILASHEADDCMYMLAVEGEEGTDVMHFKCIPAENEEVIFEEVDEEHEDFEKVFEMFKDDYKALGIDILDLEADDLE